MLPETMFPEPGRTELVEAFAGQMATAAVTALNAGASEAAVRGLVDVLMRQLDSEMLEVLAAVRAGFDARLAAMLGRGGPGGGD